ncbi:MAG: HAMP domain-containing histidine kinase [Planctomycetaceae bacterium]|nr:HAMP domain-containing histidine kinase [Planctomycetaceae bacterium]
MRWPIRSQILIPFVVVQAATIIGIAVAASWLAVRSVEETIHARLSGVAETLRQSNFPLTERILTQLRDLSGAELVALNGAGAVRASTLDNVESSVANLNVVVWTANTPITANKQLIDIQGVTYFGGQVERRIAGETQNVFVLYPQSSWLVARRNAMLTPLIIGGVLFLLGVVTSVLISRHIGRRIHRLEQQVSRIANRDFAPMTVPALNDELRDLAVKVNQMGRLLEEAIRHAGDSARSQILTQLVGGLSHQFRNALTGARVAIQLHQRRCETEDQSALETALRQLQLTEEQIKALLQVTRGKQAAQFREGDWFTLVSEVVSLISPLCVHRGIALEQEIGEGIWPTHDVDAARAAVLNMCMNAIEAAGNGGKLRISAFRESDKFVLEICDTGSSGSLEPEIFDLFYTTKPEGIGLGLFLARQVAADNHGTLTASRETDWTVFRMVLTQNKPFDGKELR